MAARDDVAVTDAGAGVAPLVSVTGLAKAFGPTQALRNASFELLPGEVHALVGENGSGKSTAVKILSGVHAPDSGSIEVDGVQLASLRSPRDAQQRGIATVFQEVFVAEARSVLENIWLGSDTMVKTGVSVAEKRTRGRAVLEEILGRSIDLGMLVEDLSLSDRQACGIVRAVLRRPRILILDEATSALDVATRDRLFQLLSRLLEDGVGIVFITHRMDEISEIGDRITVMRSGETVATLRRDDWTTQELVRLMTGADELTDHAREQAVVAERGELVLSARGLKLQAHSRPFDIDVHAGELVGVAGLEGHGQNELLEALQGTGTLAGEVIRHEDGRELVIRSPRDAARAGIAYVPRERRQATFGWMSIRENFGMPTLGRDVRFGWLGPWRTRKRLDTYVERLGIVLGGDRDSIRTLSGGNQQKVIIARGLASGPKVLLLNDPTRGIDVRTKRELYVLLARLAEEGLAVVMLSTELDEHVELMDRVLVFREHELFAEFQSTQLSRQSLVSAFFGQAQTAQMTP
jgi:ABC-type sugar transport system ATPase subunit